MKTASVFRLGRILGSACLFLLQIPQAHSQFTKPFSQSTNRGGVSHLNSDMGQDRSSKYVQEAWRRQYGSRLLSGHDRAQAAALDPTGNIYVIGYSGGDSTGYDYATIKYDSFGQQLWSARYDGLSHADDFPVAIAVNQKGEVYVTGASVGVSTGFDYVTIKYSSSGQMQWVARFNGSANAKDWPVGLAVDGHDNVHVTGKSFGAHGRFEFVTIKYNATGVQQWIVHNKSLDNDQEATAITVDDSGNVLVVGNVGRVNNKDFLTLKYNSQGKQIWSARYDNPERMGWDSPRFVITDVTGNVYVAGNSTGWGSSIDFTTIKYDANGIGQWVARYDGPQSRSRDDVRALTIDDSGNVYVAGTSEIGGGAAYITIKYDAQGNILWLARYQSEEGSDDHVLDMKLDTSGRILVSGYNWKHESNHYTTVKYDTEGKELWNKRYYGAQKRINTNHDASSWRECALVSDPNGNIYLAAFRYDSTTQDDFALIKYDTQGNTLWSSFYDGPQRNSLDKIHSLRVDNLGFVYVMGDSRGAYTGSDFATLKFDSEGNQSWIARFNGSPAAEDYVVALDVDRVGNVYVTGRSESGPSGNVGSKVATIKYGTRSEVLWTASYQSAENSFDYPGAIAINGAGEAYVATSAGLIKYDHTGKPIWILPQESGRLALDGNGHVYLGRSFYKTGTGYVFLVVQCDSTGKKIWEAQYNTPGKTSTEIASLFADNVGNVYVTGSSRVRTVSAYDVDIATVKFNRNGELQWASLFDIQPWWFRTIYCCYLAADRNGNIIVSGEDWNPAAYTTIKYDANGMQQWAAYHEGNGFGIPYGIATDSKNNIYVMGNQGTVKYNPEGEKEWAISMSGESFAVDEIGNLYFGETTISKDEWSTYTITKYIQTSVGVRDTSADTKPFFHLEQNHPNPFNEATLIQYRLSKVNNVSLKLFSTSGQEVATLVQGEQPAGEYQVQWVSRGYSSGLYIYRLQVGNIVASRKLLLLK